ncbi:flagellar export chaperone FliS [Anaeromyxobacter paludicola]|uniref:Flagellar protein FliS n=1 Tax=Anaeromyxobacter paludicola TaxID=2918171 RepID=A0ABN6N7U7_9BACT|nr:flagellar export chaperone FliS [Anaeromyxobacter paludicola]BDG08017.1 hypothetical protein AMPC_11300 [Anaeromyxobacter paludicola]
MTHASRYLQAQRETASAERLMVLLFQRALREIRAGAAAIEARQRAEANRALTRAGEIVSELHATLDTRRAPELCQQLGEIYRFVTGRITLANLRQDARLAREAERAFAPIVDGFENAVASLTTQAQGAR